MTSQIAPIMSAVPFVGIDASGRPVRPHPDFVRWWAIQVDKRIGGTTASTNVELQQSITVLNEETSALMAQIDGVQMATEAVPPILPADPASDPSGRMEALEAWVYKLATEIQALREGTVL